MKKLMLVLVVILALMPLVSHAGDALTPDRVRGWYDVNAALLMLAWGVMHTRLPVLAKVPNTLVPWVNAIGYVLAHFVVPNAGASVGSTITSFAGLAWVTARGGATSALTSLAYDKFLKPWLDRWLPKPR